MARRKQREPKRSAGYTPEVKIQSSVFSNKHPDINSFSLALHDEDYLCKKNEEQMIVHNYQTNLGDSSDFKNTFSKKDHGENVSIDPGYANDILDNLARMKDIYANLTSDASIISSRLTSSGSDTTNSNDLTIEMNNRKCLNGNSNFDPNSSVNANSASVAYDWHQAALAKTLQHNPYRGPPEPALFSTVQLYRQNNKLYGSVFTGASKFRCKDCNAAYEALVDLTVHMNKTGHYRDDNKDKEDEEDHGQRWSKPRKRSLLEMEGKEDAQKVLKCMFCGHSFESLQDLSVHMIKTKHYQKVPLKEPMVDLSTKVVPSTKNQLRHATTGPHLSVEGNQEVKGMANHYFTPNERYRYQNGASYTWPFEACKAQILKCMECGSSYNSLHQLTAHMMVTGHVLKVSSTLTKKGKHLEEEKIQLSSIPSTTTKLSFNMPKFQSFVPEDKKEIVDMDYGEPLETVIKEEHDELNVDCGRYLREDQLEKKYEGGMDILRSLENTVMNAISKAQACSPTWRGGSSSVHATSALQRSGSVKPGFNTPLSSDSGVVRNTASASEEYVRGKILVKEENVVSAQSLIKSEKINAVDTNKDGKPVCKLEPEEITSPTTDDSGICNSLSPEMSFTSPFSSLQSDMKPTLNTASKSFKPSLEPLLMLYQISNIKMDKPVQRFSFAEQNTIHSYGHSNQPMDLRMLKTKQNNSFKVIKDNIDGTKLPHMTSPLSSTLSSTQEDGLMDIPSLTKNLNGCISSKPSTPSSDIERSDSERNSFEDFLKDVSAVQKERRRQDSWNSPNLLLLQAQFKSSLRQTHKAGSLERP